MEETAKMLNKLCFHWWYYIAEGKVRQTNGLDKEQKRNTLEGCLNKHEPTFSNLAKSAEQAQAIYWYSRQGMKYLKDIFFHFLQTWKIQSLIYKYAWWPKFWSRSFQSCHKLYMQNVWKACTGLLTLQMDQLEYQKWNPRAWCRLKKEIGVADFSRPCVCLLLKHRQFYTKTMIDLNLWKMLVVNFCSLLSKRFKNLCVFDRRRMTSSVIFLISNLAGLDKWWLREIWTDAIFFLVSVPVHRILCTNRFLRSIFPQLPWPLNHFSVSWFYCKRRLAYIKDVKIWYWSC